MINVGCIVLTSLKKSTKNLGFCTTTRPDLVYQQDESQYQDSRTVFILHMMSQKSNQK